MKIKLALAVIIVSIISVSTSLSVVLAESFPCIVEKTGMVMKTVVRIQVSADSAKDEALARIAIDKAFKEAVVSKPANTPVGYTVDAMILSLKGSGIKNAFVSSEDQMYSMGMKSDKEMWKAWIPHPTDKKKVFAILRLKDKAIATVHNDKMSASVVADTTVDAERFAKDLLAKGDDGLKVAEETGLDALLVVKDGDKFRTGMAGGFKEQYGKAKSK